MAKPEFTLAELAAYLEAELVGEPGATVTGIATLDQANDSDISFFSNKRYRSVLSDSNAGCVLLQAEEQEHFQGNKILSPDPYLGYARLSYLFAPKENTATGVHPTAFVAPDVTLPPSVSIGPKAVVESGCQLAEGAIIGASCYVGSGVTVGENTLLHAHVTVHHGCTLGANCIIHSGVVIGADGFGFAPTKEGWQKIYQLGAVVIGDEVEVGANTTIDRGALSDTLIGRGVKLDNQIQIAHNVRIGDFSAIAAATAIAGSTVIGKRCTIAGCVGIVGHIEIVDDVHITGMSMVTRSISEPGTYSSGIPANETALWRKNVARFQQLDQLARDVRKLVDKKNEQS